MSKTLSPDYTRLAHERLQLEQTLYKKLLLYIMSTNVALVVVEMLRAGLSNQIEIFFTFTFLLIFIITLSMIIMRIKDRQELAITIFIGSYYLVGLIACYYGKSGYFDTPQGTFYLAYALALFERIVIARIPTSSYKIGFSICTTIIRSAVVPSSDKGIFFIQLIYVLFGIFLDFEREKRDKNLIKSYFNSRNQLEKFKNLVVNEIPDSIAIISQDLRQGLFTNKSFSELCEISSGQCIQRNLSQFRVCEEDNADTRPSNKTLLSFLESSINRNDFLTDKKFSCNLTYLQSNITFESKVFNIVWDEIPAVAIILHDITQQQTINSLKAADAHKDALLATVSHELRTPLNGMLGMIQIMQKRNKDPESVKYLSICKNSGKLLMGLVNSILDFNQIRANKLKLNPEKINLYELLRDMVQLFELQCVQKGLHIKLNILPSTQKFIVTDQNRLSQIFINLIGNALKFTIKGCITLFARGSSDGRYMQLGVEDTGIGIKDKDKGKLFKMFGKLEQDNTFTNQQGVGLGLTISDNLARLLCKDGLKEGIRMRSRYGEGSLFYFWIKSSLVTEINSLESFDSQWPVHEGRINISERLKSYSTLDSKEPTFKRLGTLFQTHSSTTTPNDNNTTFSHNGIDMRSIFNPKDESQAEVFDTLPSKPESYVLIVDDNPFNITVAEYLVTSHGYKVRTALYGQTAIDILLKNNYDTEPIKLVLMDCLMPIMDGYETTRALRKLMSQKKIPEIPIVALTANNTEADKEASKKSGMCEHLTKPLKESELFKILNKYVSNYVIS